MLLHYDDAAADAAHDFDDDDDDTNLRRGLGAHPRRIRCWRRPRFHEPSSNPEGRRDRA
jgi:hypothetical protein